MRTLYTVLLFALASGVSAQTDARLHGAWIATIEPSQDVDGIAEMWLEFDASGRMFGQAVMATEAVAEPSEDPTETPAPDAVEYSSVTMDYRVGGGMIVADGDPANFMIRDDGTLRIIDNSTTIDFARPQATILGLDVLGLWEVAGTPSRVAHFATDRNGPPTLAFHLDGADPAAAGYEPHDEGTWTVSARGLTVETEGEGTVTYTAIARDGDRITLTAASGESLTLRPLADAARARYAPGESVQMYYDRPVEEPLPALPPPPPPAEPMPPTLPIDAP